MKIFFHGKRLKESKRVRAGKRGWRTRKRREFFIRLHRYIRRFALCLVVVGAWFALNYHAEMTLLEEFPFIFIRSGEAKEILPQTPDEWFRYIEPFADSYGVSPFEMYSIIYCETGGTFDPDIQSNVQQDYGREESYGLSQIHMPDNKGITIEEAKDPDFALEFMARELSLNHGSWRWYNCSKSTE